MITDLSHTVVPEFEPRSGESWADPWPMYRALRVDTVARLGEQRYEEYDQLYAFFVGLVEDGKLGGGRFSASG